jgi:hypothetical protein
MKPTSLLLRKQGYQVSLGMTNQTKKSQTEAAPPAFAGSRRKSGGSSIGIHDLLEDPLQTNELDELPPNLPPPTQAVCHPSPTAHDTLHIPPYIVAIGTEHPEVLIAYITNHSKQLDLKRAQEETARAQLEATAPTTQYRYNTSTLRTSASRGSTGDSQDPKLSNPWFESQIAEVRQYRSIFVTSY